MNIQTRPDGPDKTWSVEAGRQVTDLPSFEDILALDEEAPPTILKEAGDAHPGPRPISFDRYFDQRYVDLEVEHIWRKQWQVVCREEDLPKVGDRINYDIVDDSYLVVRSGEHEFKAFYNSCRHRGRKLCEARESGRDIRCAYHGWTYGLDGALDWIPLEQDFPQVDRKHSGLVPIRVATWGGNVFINPDPNAPPLSAALGPLVEHFERYDIGARYTSARMIIEVGCNWKAAQEAFAEGYHVLETHTDGMPMYNSVATRIDCWSQGLGYVARLITPGVVSDSWVADRVSPRETLEMYCKAYNLTPPPADRGLTPADARKYVAQDRARRLHDDTGKDWSTEPTSYFVDQCKYFLFPNHSPFWGEGMPRWQTFKPLGRDPNSCQMEFRTLLPVPASGERPPVPEPIHVKLGESVKERYPILGQAAHLLDQDLDNMCANQRGFKAAAANASFMTLSDTQEAILRRFNELYDQVVGLDED